MRECHQNCSSCTKGFDPTTGEMNCDTCQHEKYFENITSTNCI